MSLDTKGTAVSLAFQDGSGRFILQRVGPSQPTLIELIRKTYPGAYYEKLPEAFSLVGEADSDSVIKSSSNIIPQPWLWSNLRKSDGSSLPALSTPESVQDAFEYAFVKEDKDYTTVASQLFLINYLVTRYVVTSACRPVYKASIPFRIRLKLQDSARLLVGLFTLADLLDAAIYGARMDSEGGVCVGNTRFTPEAVREVEKTFGVLFRVA